MLVGGELVAGTAGAAVMGDGIGMAEGAADALGAVLAAGGVAVIDGGMTATPRIRIAPTDNTPASAGRQLLLT